MLVPAMFHSDDDEYHTCIEIIAPLSILSLLEGRPHQTISLPTVHTKEGTLDRDIFAEYLQTISDETLADIPIVDDIFLNDEEALNCHYYITFFKNEIKILCFVLS